MNPCHHYQLYLTGVIKLLFEYNFAISHNFSNGLQNQYVIKNTSISYFNTVFKILVKQPKHVQLYRTN